MADLYDIAGKDGVLTTGGRLRISHLRVDGLDAPLGRGSEAPAFSWQINGAGRDLRQAGYCITVATGGEEIWSSGRVDSNRTIDIRYAGPSLRSRRRYAWTVRIWDGEKNTAQRSSWWETGLFPEDWSARWITYVEPDTVTEPPFADSSPSPYLRRELHLVARPLRARVYVTALGLYELRINGTRIGSQQLTPGWTDYRRRVQVQAFDVTDVLAEGPNAIGAVLADGWYAGRVGFFGRLQYGDHPLLALQLEIDCEDGSTVTLVTDARWRGSTGPLRKADILTGILDDRRFSVEGWDRPGFDDRHWARADMRASSGAALVPQLGAEIEVIDELTPVSIDERNGSFIVDFGQNIAGRVRIESPPEAATVTVRHGEMLDADGSLYTDNLRSALQRDEYIVDGHSNEPLVAPFTYHGFRYAELTGIAGVRAEDVRAEVLSSSLHQTGTFACSDPLLNKLQENIVWGQRGNFLSIPTDCPQRDERLGWTGDALNFVGTASFNYDTLPFFRKWLVDLDDAQLPSGAYPDIAPLISWSGAGNAGWAEVGVLLPWTLYVRYADQSILSDRYDGMKRFVRYLEEDSTCFIRHGGRYGDWVCLGAHTPKEIVGTAYFAATASTMQKISTVLGKDEDAERFAALFESVRDAFAREFIGGDGTILGETQTAYLLALHFDLVPQETRAAVIERLVEGIERTGHLTTGFLGTPIALPVLTRIGQHELACRLVQRNEYPSWGFSVKQGATTIWERWDGWTPEAGFQDSSMNSFNHYSRGAVGDWLYRDLAGLDPDEREPGYGRVAIRPRPGGTLTSAAVTYDSVRGRFECGWRIEDGLFTLALTVPANAAADIWLPNDGPVRENGSVVERADTSAPLTVGSGTYNFDTSAAVAGATP